MIITTSITDWSALFVTSPERCICCPTILTLHFYWMRCMTGFRSWCNIRILRSIGSTFRRHRCRSCSSLRSLRNTIIESRTATATGSSSGPITMTIAGTGPFGNVRARHSRNSSCSRRRRSAIHSGDFGSYYALAVFFRTGRRGSSFHALWTGCLPCPFVESTSVADDFAINIPAP